MQITKDFLEAEIGHLTQEARKAHEFTVKAGATIDAYRMLIARLDAPEPEIPAHVNESPQ